MMVHATGYDGSPPTTLTYQTSGILRNLNILDICYQNTQKLTLLLKSCFFYISNTTTAHILYPQMSNTKEFEWLLDVDVGATIAQLTQILTECSAGISTTPKQYNLFYCSQNQLDVIKINTTLEGYKITNADINIKLASKHPIQTIKTCVKETPNDPFCWRLHQIQDAINHLSIALDLLTSAPLRKKSDNKYDFKSSSEVLQLINEVMNCLQKSRSSLLIPKKRTIEELQHSQNMQSIRPALPLDYSISFYIQAHNLVCSVYQLSQSSNGPQIRAEYQAELSLPFLSEVLVFLSLGLQTCQQIKDKLQTFSFM